MQACPAHATHLLAVRIQGLAAPLHGVHIRLAPRSASCLSLLLHALLHELLVGCQELACHSCQQLPQHAKALADL